MVVTPGSAESDTVGIVGIGVSSSRVLTSNYLGDNKLQSLKIEPNLSVPALINMPVYSWINTFRWYLSFISTMEYGYNTNN